MYLESFPITPDTVVSEIVAHNYRTAEIFRKYGIGYCCGARWPLQTVCMMKGVEMEPLIRDLKNVIRPLQLPSLLPFEKWSIDFLVDYIVNIHHYYLSQQLPVVSRALHDFTEEHAKKYPSFLQVSEIFSDFTDNIIPHIKQEEEIIFPYLCQVAHAYEGKESFASLLVKTLRKPVSRIMEHEHDVLEKSVYMFRELTGNYTPPANACPSHRVVLSKLHELDNDLVQHVYLENEVLFPRIIAMEKELLQR
jgi:regulator of cell morphogenesis and NO signaling